MQFGRRMYFICPLDAHAEDADRLPEGVIDITCPASGIRYYKNTRTDERLWADPRPRHRRPICRGDPRPLFGPEQPAARSGRIEGEGYDGAERRRYGLKIQEDYRETRPDVQKRHQRYYNRGGAGNAPHAPVDHRGSHGGEREPHAEIEREVAVVQRDPKLTFDEDVAQNLHKLIGLKERQTANERNRTEESGQRPGPGRHALPNDVHRPALDLARAVWAPEVDCQGTGEELRRNAEERGNPHPENGARAAGGQRHGYARNVAHTDRARERARERPKVAQLTGGGVFVEPTAKQFVGMREMTEGEQAGCYEEPGAAAQQQHEQPWAPCESGKCG